MASGTQFWTSFAEAPVLPFTKRNARPADEDSEVIRTAEIEVLRSKSAYRAQPPRARSMSSSSDEELTRVAPGRKPAATPPASVRRPWSPAPAVAAGLGSVREDAETLVRASASMSPFPSARVAAGRRADQPLSPDSIPPVALCAPSRAGTVITPRPRTPGRPTAIWAAALVAMGVFAGLASSVLARGDADSIVDATASFVDPARAGSTHTASAAAVGQLAVAMPVVMSAQSPAPQPAPVAPAPVAAVRAHLPPVAYAAPARAVAHHPAKPVPRAPAEAKVAASEPKTAPAKAAPKAAHAHNDEDMVESASAADALARAQLEAALR